ncbi:MAG: hypothetical protein OXG81_08925, partial [Acidobacteria bacterium]|nr:hypothetical protein [Acidobacteriota bacterium]
LSTSTRFVNKQSCSKGFQRNLGPVLVLHTPIIIFEIHLRIICIAGGKNRKENMEGLKTVQLSTVVVTLLYRCFARYLPVKDLIS